MAAFGSSTIRIAIANGAAGAPRRTRHAHVGLPAVAQGPAMQPTDLPAPDADALAHSARLSALLR
ncbi:MAG: hypothetical protein KGL63_13810, partial [Betaproteobacteria bacterium]|nr:hypothetical protein [Betaproteobacteria bacterium]